MSHTTEINEVLFSDPVALQDAVKELNKQGVKCELIKDAKPRAYFDNQQGMGKADYVLKLQDSPYDVGFYADSKQKGVLKPRTDFFGGHIQRLLGAKTSGKETANQGLLGKLNQAYQVAAAVRQAVRQGYSVQKKTKADGTISLVMTGIKV